MQRRTFIQQSAATMAAMSFSSIYLDSQQSKYETALIGSGWWGMNILTEAIKAGRSKVVALCDVDERYLKPAAAKVKELNGDTPKLYKDYRELLKKEKPRIVIVATPDHWHALIAIEAIK